jgi:hypothetical protein
MGFIVWLAAVPAYAQTTPAAPVQPAVTEQSSAAVPEASWFLGALSGAQIVERTKPILGGEFGIKLRKNTQFVVEFGRLPDVATESRIDEVRSFATYIQQTQDLPASGDITGRSLFALGGLRYVHENTSGIRPYVQASAGMARVEFQPVFTVDGRNVGSSVTSFGVTLGRDLLGTLNHFAYGGGAGLILGDRWYLDIGFRLLRINTPDHATNVRRVNVGIGRRF